MSQRSTSRFLVFAAVLAVIGSSTAVFGYDKNDLEEFNKTGHCVGCDLSGIDFHGQDLTGVMLQRSNLIGANLSGCNLKKANLSWTFLMKANLTDVDLSGGTLRGAYMSNSDLSGANLTNVDLWGSTYYHAQLLNVQGLENNPTK